MQRATFEPHRSAGRKRRHLVLKRDAGRKRCHLVLKRGAGRKRRHLVLKRDGPEIDGGCRHPESPATDHGRPKVLLHLGRDLVDLALERQVPGEHRSENDRRQDELVGRDLRAIAGRDLRARSERFIGDNAQEIRLIRSEKF